MFMRQRFASNPLKTSRLHYRNIHRATTNLWPNDKPKSTFHNMNKIGSIVNRILERHPVKYNFVGDFGGEKVLPRKIIINQGCVQTFVFQSLNEPLIESQHKPNQCVCLSEPLHTEYRLVAYVWLNFLRYGRSWKFKSPLFCKWT